MSEIFHKDVFVNLCDHYLQAVSPTGLAAGIDLDGIYQHMWGYIDVYLQTCPSDYGGDIDKLAFGPIRMYIACRLIKDALNQIETDAKKNGYPR